MIFDVPDDATTGSWAAIPCASRRRSPSSRASRPASVVLDTGAGTGALTAELIQRGAEVAAAEPSAGFVAGMRSRFPGIEVLEAPAEEMPWPDGSFDTALAQLVTGLRRGRARNRARADASRPSGRRGGRVHVGPNGLDLRRAASSQPAARPFAGLTDPQLAVPQRGRAARALRGRRSG